MSSYKQLSNQGTLLLGAGASVSRDKRRPISGAISTGHSRRRRRCCSPLSTQSKGRNGQSSRVVLLCLQIEPELCDSGKKLQSCESVRKKGWWRLKKEELLLQES